MASASRATSRRRPTTRDGSTTAETTTRASCGGRLQPGTRGSHRLQPGAGGAALTGTGAAMMWHCVRPTSRQACACRTTPAYPAWRAPPRGSRGPTCRRRT
eukprot:7233575-Prymnesium_polylepis.1